MIILRKGLWTVKWERKPENGLYGGYAGGT